MVYILNCFIIYIGLFIIYVVLYIIYIGLFIIFIGLFIIKLKGLSSIKMFDLYCYKLLLG